MMMVMVAIVGAGPAGLSTAACLSVKHNIHDFVIFEREDCCASLWRRRAYDRLHLHLSKKFCSLPCKPHSKSAPNFMPRNQFIEYIDDYVSRFNIKPRYCHSVTKASYVEGKGMWKIEALDTRSNKTTICFAEFLVVATGENTEPFIPSTLSGCQGDVIHSSGYKSGVKYSGKDVLVVGGGNSGFEICYDLANHGARPSMVIRSPVHVVTNKLVEIGMRLLRYLPVWIVDSIIVSASRWKFGDLSKYGIARPSKGPFQIKNETGRSPTIDVGAVPEIKNGNIKIFPGIARVDGRYFEFENGTRAAFDAVILATGYRNNACQWLQGYERVLKEKGSPKEQLPTHWKGKQGTYCVGLYRRGLPGINKDAQNVAQDIANILATKDKDL